MGLHLVSKFFFFFFVKGQNNLLSKLPFWSSKLECCMLSILQHFPKMLYVTSLFKEQRESHNVKKCDKNV